MSAHTDELLKKHNLTPDAIHLPAGGVAVFGKTGNGKSSLFRNSRFIRRVLIADSGSMMHKLWAGEDRCLVVTTDKEKSPTEQVRDEVEACEKAGGIYLLDSWSTLQELQVLWFKRVNRIIGQVSIPKHGDIVAMLRDLIPILAQTQGFSIFNTTAGGESKTPKGDIVYYPAGALTGYQSLNGTEPNKEPILSRWGTVWGMFQGHPPKDLPRGLYVPAHDIRPESYAKYAPLKDPLEVVRDTSAGKGVMVVPDRSDPANVDRCFIDELLVEIAAKFPRRKPTPPPTTTPPVEEKADAPARKK